MFGLVLAALRARRSQTVALFALTVLAALGAAAAPWFLGWARDAVADANIAAAPAEQRVVSASGPVRLSSQTPDRPTTLMRDRVAQHLAVPGAEIAVGARLYVTIAPVDGAPGAASGLYLAYRDGVCQYLRIEGRCPDGDGEVVIGKSSADTLGLGVGDVVELEGFRLPAPVRMTVSGVYEVTDLLGTYWAGTDLLAGTTGVLSTRVDDPAFVSEATLLAAMPEGVDMDYHVVLPPGAYHRDQVDLATTLNDATNELRTASLDVQTQALRLVDQIRADQRLVELGITVAALQLVALCWIALFLAVRHASEERRTDIGLLKLRGAAPWRIWALTAQQSALPMVLGGVVGWGLGFLAAAVLAGEAGGVARTTDTDPAATLWLSVVAAGVACLGALVAAVVAEWQALRSPVVALLRRVPPRHRGWRAEVFDLVVVVVAVAGVYQGHADLARAGEASFLALLAPGLVGLAAALVIARILPWLAGIVGRSAVANGRAGAALAALHLARRPGTQRVFAVLVVSASVVSTTTLFWHTATRAWSDRAVQAVGAHRVLTVQAATSTALLAAVRDADPEGRHAMAAARTAGPDVEDRVLAVDTSRLAAVVDLPASYGLPDPAALARLLHPPSPDPLAVLDGPITVDAGGPADLGPAYAVTLRLQVADRAGRLLAVDIGPLEQPRRTYTGEVAGCAGGCRLISIELVSPARIRESLGGSVEVHGIAQGDGEIASAALLGDISRWRPPAGAVGVGTVLRAGDGVLRVSLFTGPMPNSQRVDPRVFVVDAPTPLPVVLAGARPEAGRAGDERITVLGTERVAFQVVATAAVLPRLGDVGVLADLEYAQRLLGRAGEAASLEVWLSPDAPAGVVDDLAGRGVQVIHEDTRAAAVNRLAEQGPGVALRFQLFAAGIVLLLAAGTIVVTAAVERHPRVEELTALRAQGLDAASVRVAAYAGPAVMVAGGLLTGLVAAVAAGSIVTASMPVFADDWHLLPLLTGPRPVPLGLAGLAAVAVLGPAAMLGATRIARAVESRSDTGGAA